MSIRIQFFGVAGYRFTTSDGARIVIDPFMDSNPFCPIGTADLGKVDVLLLTHNAYDHFGDAPALIRQYKPIVVCAVDVQHHLVKYHGIDADLIRPTIWGMEVEAAGISVKPVESHHWSLARKDDGQLLSGPAMGFVVDVGEGKRIYHPGDTALFTDMKLIGQFSRPTIGLMHVSLPAEPGVALPHSECYKTGEVTPAEALIASEWLGLETVVTSHYVDPGCRDVKEFISLVERNKHDGRYAPEVVVLAPGEEYEA